MTRADLLALKCWKAPSDPEPLPGGITNRNYRVRDTDGSYVVRLCDEYPHLGIDRRSERVCQEAAYRAGLAPEIVHAEAGVLVSRFIEARTLCDADVANEAMLRRLATTLRKLHDARDALAGEMLYFCPFQTVRTYTATARRLGAALPADMEALLEDARQLSAEIGPFLPTLCHNDLLAANILDDGEQLWLVDWEYAGMGNPLFDLASISANCGLREGLETTLLTSYGRIDPAVALPQVRILKTISLLREALWATIQTKASQIDFDYGKYAGENLDQYRQARERLS